MHNNRAKYVSQESHTIYIVFSFLVLAAVLRIYNLNSQLWIDEISALTGSIRRPISEILSQWPGASSHIFYEFLAKISLRLFGDEPFSIRVPAVIFGIAGVVMIFILTSEILGKIIAFLVTGLFSVSYHHIFFSQNARGYTTLIFFSLLATYYFIRFHKKNKIPLTEGVMYAFTAALAAYTIPFGVVVIIGHTLLVIGEWLKCRIKTTDSSYPFFTYIAFAAFAGLIILALYIPFFDSIITFAKFNAETAAEGPRIGLWLIQEIYEGLIAAFFGPAGLTVGIILGLLGVYQWYKRDVYSLLALSLPIIILGLILVVFNFGIHPRYFSGALPVAYIVIAIALVFLVEILFSRANKKVEYVTYALIIMAAALPLNRYYKYPKQDFKGAIQTINKLSADEDLRVGIQVAGSVATNYYKTKFIKIDGYEELLKKEQGNSSIWLMTTLERLVKIEDSKLFEHIQDNYRRVGTFPGTVGGGAVNVYKSIPPEEKK